MSGLYRVVLCDLRSDQVLDILPAQGLKLDDYIGKTGGAQFSIPVTDATMARRAREAVIPARTAVWIERAGEVWWGGIVWTREITPPSRGRPGALAVQAATFDSYLAHRLLSAGWTGTGVDQFDIARQIVDWVQSTDGGDIGIELDWSQTSGVLRDRTYSRYDLPVVRDVLDQLAGTENGFEWRIRTYRDADGRRVKGLQLGYPIIRSSRTELVLSSPGPVIDYRMPEDGTARATHWHSRGASINRNQTEPSYPLMSAPVAVDGAVTPGGWPRLDGTSDYTSVEKQATLDAHARADLARAWTTTQVPTVSVRLDGSGISPGLLGSTIRLRIRDEWHPEGLDARYRLIGLATTPAERGRPETADLLLEPNAAPATLTA
ncbi:minor tail protein [Streptomyces phage Austintatious]|uniref:Minor tail protein n=1 Tax=Streptomyces phage Austintatious TaxID=2500795 RepID=A0A411AXI8_9CAUD|nr:minor tail protein [Streptomyces phage Austintatious]QAX92780.1 minor tail protein [Streptomyces phage Austintatious]